MNSFRLDNGRNLLTFNNNNVNNTNGLSRIITNPLAAYDSSNSDISFNKNYLNQNNQPINSNSNQYLEQYHYYASNEITKMPFNDSMTSSSSSTTKNSGKYSINDYCDNEPPPPPPPIPPTISINSHISNDINNGKRNEFNNMHNQMIKSKIHRKRKYSFN